MLLQTTATTTPLNQDKSHHFCCGCLKNHQSSKTSSLLPKTLFLPSLDSNFYYYLGAKSKRAAPFSGGNGNGTTTRSRTAYATLLETPVLWAGRVCIFYALLKAGLAGSPSSPFISLGPFYLFRSMRILLKQFLHLNFFFFGFFENGLGCISLVISPNKGFFLFCFFGFCNVILSVYQMLILFIDRFGNWWWWFGVL